MAAAATIYDVARQAGVSIKSVSRVMNGERVSDKLRSKVQAAMDALGYRPSISARGLAGSSSFVLAALMDADLTVEHWRSGRGNDYLSRLELGALMECRHSGYHLLVELVDLGSEDLEREVLALLGALRPDGLILSPPVSDALVALDVLDRRGVPYVRLGAETHLDRGRRVFMDDHRAAYDMTLHLAQLGHRDIGFIVGDARFAASQARRQGFEKAMARQGLEVRPEWVLSGDFTYQSGLQGGLKLLSGARRPTAVFASNDEMAFGVVQAAQREGLSVPGDVSVVGFDDAPGAQFSVPQLTTIRQPVAEMAEIATRMLIDLARGAEEPPRVQQVSYALLARGSSAPPPLS